MSFSVIFHANYSKIYVSFSRSFPCTFIPTTRKQTHKYFQKNDKSYNFIARLLSIQWSKISYFYMYLDICLKLLVVFVINDIRWRLVSIMELLCVCI